MAVLLSFFSTMALSETRLFFSDPRWGVFNLEHKILKKECAGIDHNSHMGLRDPKKKNVTEALK